ncbi:flagellar basal body L-ring protein FlgH [Thermocrinis sp.]
MRWLVLVLLILSSCAKKTTTLEEYERKNPYPGKEQSLEYVSRGSLMPREGFNDLYSENRASKVGDVIYVQIVESINAVESVANQTGRSASFKESVASLFGISKSTLDELTAQGSGQFNTQARGKVQQSGVLTTKLAGRVVKVYPNGTLLIEAKKSFYMNNAEREVFLRGVVRPQDIDLSNTITSDKIANLEVFIDGKGFLADGGSPGWLARILAKVLPF